MATQVLKGWNVPMAVFTIFEDIMGDGSANVWNPPADFSDGTVFANWMRFGKSDTLRLTVEEKRRNAWVLQSGNSDHIVVYLDDAGLYKFDGGAYPIEDTFRIALNYNQQYDAARIMYDFLMRGVYPN